MFLQKNILSFINEHVKIALQNSTPNPPGFSFYLRYFFQDPKHADDNLKGSVSNPKHADCDPRLIDYNLNAIDYDLSFSDYDPSLIDYDLSLWDYDLSFSDCDPSLTDYDLSFSDYDLSLLDLNLNALDLKLKPEIAYFRSKINLLHLQNSPKPAFEQAKPPTPPPVLTIFSSLNTNCMSNGRFPGKEADLNNYYQLVVPYLTTNAVRLKIMPDTATALTSNFTAWNAAYPASQNPATRTQTITDSKNVANQNMRSTLRTIFDDIPESILTIEDRNTLNLQQRSTTRTAAPVPITKPIAQVDTSKHLEHTISFNDENTPNSTAKPDGVRGCQIWIKVGSSAVDPSELQYVATDTASPYVNHFMGVNAGKPVYYWLRWENTRGETGPWSDAVMATIPA